MFSTVFGALCGSLVACIWMGISIVNSLIKQDWDFVKCYVLGYLIANALTVVSFLGCCKVLFG